MPQVIRASLASIPERAELLERTVASLLPQVDRVGVYLNGWDTVPAFLERPRVDVARSQEHGRRGDAGKFFWADAGDFDYQLTCDDDLIYPPDWAESLVQGAERHHRRALVGMHGARLGEQPQDYHRSLVSRFRCLDAVDGEHAVHVLGTGALCWHRSLALDPAIFKHPNMADLWLAAWAQREAVPRIVLPHAAGWLVSQKAPRSIWAASVAGEGGDMDTGARQAELVRETDWRLITAPRCKVVVSIVTYNRGRGLRRVLSEVERESRRFDGEIEVRIHDDCSPRYDAIRRLCAARGYIFTSAPRHYGKAEHWRLIADELAGLRDRFATWYVFLPDDVRLCDHFFAHAIATWETLEWPTALNLSHHLSRPGGCWTGCRPREVGEGVEVGWIDGLYLSRRELLERVDFSVPRPGAEWLRRWLAKGRGSGTGALLSRELVAGGARLYRVKHSLTHHQGIPSIMHPARRKTEPQTHIDPHAPFATYPVGRARIAADPADHIGKILAAGRWYEADLLEAIRELAVKGLYVDVGAHVGGHTAFFATACGARVLAVEPSADSFVRLVATVEASGIGDRVTAIRAAVHESWLTARIVRGPPGNSGMARAEDGGEAGTAPVIHLDELLWDECVGLLKIDVEGSALEVLRSGLHVIRRDHPVIAAEVGEQREEVDRLLSGCGYGSPSGPFCWTPSWLWQAD